MKKYWFCLLLILLGCSDKLPPLVTKSITVGENKCIVQQLPASFEEGHNKNSKFDYYKIVLESKAKLKDSSSINYVNFGMESSMLMVIGKDTIPAAFAERIANGQKDNYEYIVAFAKRADKKNFQILINDQALEIGQVAIQF
jgi:hypothetical protein